jgi:hypothetical protein
MVHVAVVVAVVVFQKQYHRFWFEFEVGDGTVGIAVSTVRMLNEERWSLLLVLLFVPPRDAADDSDAAANCKRAASDARKRSPTMAAPTADGAVVQNIWIFVCGVESSY